MKRQALGGILAVLIVILMTGISGEADATTDIPENCAGFYNHSGNIPGSYDYAEFYEAGVLITTVQTNGEDTFVDPAQWNAGESWDVVYKCQYGETTTTLAEETTTTVAETTTTVQDTTTTTSNGNPPPELVQTTFLVTIACMPDGTFEVAAEFGDGVDFIELTLDDPQFPINPDNFDGVVMTRENAVITGNVGGPTAFQATAFPKEGWTIVSQNPMFLAVDVCPVATTTSVTPTTSTSELPFTGINRDLFVGLGVSALALGALLLAVTRKPEDI